MIVLTVPCHLPLCRTYCRNLSHGVHHVQEKKKALEGDNTKR